MDRRQEGGPVVNANRLTNTNSRLGRHLSRAREDVQEAARLQGPQRRAILRGAARQFMQAGFHDLARDVRRRARGGAE
ncbi:hypothetical protein LBMAG47_18400 [Planctomycetia bacterium]|nr:hypothetical protein LBMAG47_18400 [Planctomycetia bacterium]